MAPLLLIKTYCLEAIGPVLSETAQYE